MNTVHTYFKSFGFYPLDYENGIKNLITPVNVHKATLIYKPGTICPFIWYLERGLIRIYKIVDGKEANLYIQDAHEIVICPDSSLDGKKPTETYIETIEDSRLQQARMKDVLEFMKENPGFSSLYININAHYRRLEEERKAAMSNPDPEYRFLSVLKDNPTFFRRVKHEILQEYTRISHNTYDELRKRHKV